MRVGVPGVVAFRAEARKVPPFLIAVLSGSGRHKAQPRPSEVEFVALLPTKIDHVSDIFRRAGSRRVWGVVAWHGHRVYPAI